MSADMDIDNNNDIVVKNTKGANRADEFSTEWLEVYYKRLFPYDAMFDWLSYGNDRENHKQILFSKSEFTTCI